MGLQVGINYPMGCQTGIKKPTLCGAGCGDCRCRPHRALLLWRIHLTLRQVGMDSQTQLKMWGGLFGVWRGLSIARMMVGSLKMGNSVFRLPIHYQKQPENLLFRNRNHLLRQQFGHAIKMPQRAFAFKTWAAIQIERGNLGFVAQRRRVFGAG